MNMSIRSQMGLIMGEVIPDQWVLSALETEKLNFISLFGIYLYILTCTAYYAGERYRTIMVLLLMICIVFSYKFQWYIYIFQFGEMWKIKIATFTLLGSIPLFQLSWNKMLFLGTKNIFLQCFLQFNFMICAAFNLLSANAVNFLWSKRAVM